MREGRASLTAMLVAAFRGLADDPDHPGRPLDPFAEQLLPARLSWAMRCGRPLLKVPGARLLYHVASAGLPPHIELRTHAVDRAVRAALRAGNRGLLLLGAGLDNRARRLAELAGHPVWEVDHPDTQALKIGRVGDHVRHVAVDFNTDSLEQRLRAAGWSDTEPICCVWEGVTPYLPPEATQATLDAMGRLLAPGSHLLVTWATPEMITLPPMLRPFGHRLFGLIGEPLLGLMTAEAFDARLRSAGFDVIDHTGVEEWAASSHRRVPAVRIHERLLVAVRSRAPAPATG